MVLAQEQAWFKKYIYSYIGFVLMITFANMYAKVSYAPEDISKNIYLSCLVISFVLSLKFPKLSIGIATTQLALFAGLEQQAHYIFHVPLSNTLTIDIALLFIQFFFVATILREKGLPKTLAQRWVKYFPVVFIISLIHIWSFASMVDGIITNLNHSTKSWSMAQYFLSMGNLRQLGWHHDFHNIRYMLHYTTASCLGLIVLDQINSQKDALKVFIYPLTTAAMGIFSFGLYSYYYRWGHNQLGTFSHGMNSLLPDIHSFGNFGMLAFLACLASLKSIKNKRSLILVGLVSLIPLYFIYRSGSRASILLTCFSIAAMTFINIRAFKPIQISLLLSTMTIVSYIFIALNPRMNFVRSFNFERLSSFSGLNYLFTYRLGIYQTGLNMAAQLPLTGVGIGNFFRYSTHSDFSPDGYLLRVGGENAHNYFLQVLCEQGLVGLSLLALIMLPLASKTQEMLPAIAKGIAIAIILGNILGHTLITPFFLTMFVISLAIVAKYQYLRRQESSFHSLYHR